jgi:hypothetical protein
MPSGGESTPPTEPLPPTEPRTVDPRKLKLLEKNAHYLKAATYNRLVANIKRDGCLTSSPLTHTGDLLNEHGKVVGHNDNVVLSGNHRVKAAIEAGLKTIPDLHVHGPLTKERATALVLAHNAINGEDDPNILHELYASLSFAEKQYSGLTDDAFKNLLTVDVSSLAIGSQQFEEVRLTFLPEDAKSFLEYLKRIGKSDRHLHLAAHLADFDKVFEAVVAVKKRNNVHNTALAVHMLAELALERLEQLAEDDKAAAE